MIPVTLSNWVYSDLSCASAAATSFLSTPASTARTIPYRAALVGVRPVVRKKIIPTMGRMSCPRSRITRQKLGTSSLGRPLRPDLAASRSTPIQIPVK